MGSISLDAVAQDADAFDAHVHHVSVLHRADPRRRARRDHVPGLEGVPQMLATTSLQLPSFARAEAESDPSHDGIDVDAIPHRRDE